MPVSKPPAPPEKPDPDESLWAVVRRSRPFLLLLVLILNLLLAPLLANPWARLAFQAAIILAAASLAADTPAHRRLTSALVVPGLALEIAGEFSSADFVKWAGYIFVLGLYLHVIRLLLHRIFRSTRVGLDEIGFALCTYVLLGHLWVLFYAPLVALDPEAIAFGTPPTGAGRGAALAYFSYVTLTTLGYGDIQPVSPVARGLAVTEALTGVLFLAVLIARLVGRYSAERD